MTTPVGPTHFDDAGDARMVDVTQKDVTVRVATAESRLILGSDAAAVVRRGTGRKGDVLSVARLAAIGAVKHTATLIPLCHGIPIEAVDVAFAWQGGVAVEEKNHAGEKETLRCRVTVRTSAKTGVEMEAMTGASVAGLTVYDMLKSVQRDIVISDVRLLHKQGGKSGDYHADSATAGP